jgi:hypothetical protein
MNQYYVPGIFAMQEEAERTSLMADPNRRLVNKNMAGKMLAA